MKLLKIIIEVIDINSGVSTIAKSIPNCIVPETIIDIRNANHPDIKHIPITIHGTRKLNFQTKWFKLFPWLNWDISIKKMTCYLCSNLNENQRNTLKCNDFAFISKGYLNCKKSLSRFSDYPKSALHSHSMELCHIKAITPLLYNQQDAQ